MSERECDFCRRRTTLFICMECVRVLKKELDTVPWLSDQLDITLARQGRMTAPEGRIGRVRGTQDESLPYNTAASDKAALLHDTLVAWVRDLCETRGVEYTGTDSTASLGRFLSLNVMAIAASDTAALAYDELLDAIMRARRVIDRPLSRIYIGPCGKDCGPNCTCDRKDLDERARRKGCTADLYAAAGQPTVDCPGCYAQHKVEERRDELREQVRNVLGTAVEIARMLPWILGAPVRAQTIRQWASRGRLVAHSLDQDGYPLYRIGDVIDLHVKTAARASGT